MYVCKTYHALVVMVAVQFAVSAQGVLLLFLKDIEKQIGTIKHYQYSEVVKAEAAAAATTKAVV